MVNKKTEFIVMGRNKRNIIMAALMTMREMTTIIMDDTQCDLSSRIKQMDEIIKSIGDKDYKIMIVKDVK